jgi:non-specific serine/threonine protein kinase
MGEVYLASDSVLGRDVALKVLPPQFVSEPQRLARFEREARAASALNHPNILTVYDVGEQSGTHFIVTELVDGVTLRDWVQDARPSLADLAEAARQAALALSAAHNVGIVHRDVKPENLMRRRDGYVKVLDFGIAKAIAPANGVYVSHDDIAVTETGTLIGTARYMSPEQALGHAVDGRSDVWSLGVVLYELASGRSPFYETSLTSILLNITTREPVPLSNLVPKAPKALCRIVERALRRDPSERYQTASEMAHALEAVGRGFELPSQGATTVKLSATRAGNPATMSGAALATHLLPRTTALIGRSRELAEVLSALRKPGEQLLTLTGPGGTGKTRLAIEVGRQLLRDRDFPDGVIVVDLSPLSDPVLIASSVAQALGVVEAPGGSLADALEGYLSDKHLLLVLDNFEHLLEGAPLICLLLAASPGLKVLATSRAPLRLTREREYAVEPLEVPPPANLPPLGELARVPAVTLFVERARQAKPAFELTPENAGEVAQVCRRLDGLPLALELAAARVKLLTPRSMLERLDHSLRFLTGGARDLPRRQQTMRGAVAWSYDLLDKEERAVLRRLAVFVGGCTLDAAESVCVRGGEVAIEALGSLVEKSLVMHREQEDGEERFTMLEVVREYAIEQLEASGEAHATRLSFARYFKHMTEEAEPEIRSGNQVAWVRRLSREHDNLKAAMALLLVAEPQEGAAFVASIQSYWTARSYNLAQRQAWYARALGAGPLPPAIRARLLNGLCRYESRVGRPDSAVAFGRQAVEAGRASGNKDVLGIALSGLGNALSVAGDLGAAREVFEEYAEITRQISPFSLSVALGCLGEVARMSSDLETASTYYEQALDAAGRHVRSNPNAIVLANLGGVSLEKGDYASAATYYRESLAIVAELENSLWAAVALNGLTAVALIAGDGRRAALLAGAAEALCEEAGTPLEAWEQSRRDRNAAALRSALDATTLHLEWTRGHAMTLQEAAAAALDE